MAERALACATNLSPEAYVFSYAVDGAAPWRPDGVGPTGGGPIATGGRTRGHETLKGWNIPFMKWGWWGAWSSGTKHSAT